MNENIKVTSQHPVITISREYGAGGRTVARGLSAALGIPWYDRDFVKEAAETSGYSVEDINMEGETLSKAGAFMNSFLNNIVSYTSSHDEIFKGQVEAILQLSSSPCIIVGRCANIILREAQIPSFDIFLYADIEARMARAKELGEAGNSDLRKFVKKMDALRENYYRTYTKRELGSYKDYDIGLNTGKLGTEKCIELLTQTIRNL